MSSTWRKSAAKKLLAKEIKDGNIPFDGKEMGPKAVYDAYKHDPAFVGIEYDAAFTRRLRDLRKKLSEAEEDEAIDWRNSIAKQFLKQAFRDSLISLDYDKEKTGAKQVWDTHCANNPAFEEMNFGSTFTRRLQSVRDDYVKKNSRAKDDQIAFNNFRATHPEPTHNHRGEPRWEGSTAQKLLKQDMADGKHIGIRPKYLQASRPEYLEINLASFRDHIYQEQRLWKFQNYLVQESEKKKQKLK